MREKLKDAMRKQDKSLLDKVITECVSAGLPELDTDIDKARSLLDILRGGTGGESLASTLFKCIGDY